MDRLHTCYAPVRRSPPYPYCYFNALPLDLHVLGLSLAFILSQDQTLRCKKNYFLSSKRLSNYELWILNYERIAELILFFINHNWFIVYLINGNFLLQYTIYIIYRFLFLYYILYWQSFKDQSLRFFRKRVQNYCFFATWPNFLEDFLNYLRNSLIFSTHYFE